MLDTKKLDIADAIITLHDKRFAPFIAESQVQEHVRIMAAQINQHYAHINTPLLLIGVLNGAFIFAADLMRHLHIPCEITFVKLQSYSGTSSTGTVQTAIGLNTDLKDREVLVLEDIIDTGRTLDGFLRELYVQQPASIAIAALLIKPDALQVPLKADFFGFSIPNKFVVGYGLDYDGLGRNLNAIYQLDEPIA